MTASQASDKVAVFLSELSAKVRAQSANYSKERRRHGLQDVVNVPITQIDTVIEVISKGDGSHERDQVMVSSNLTLAADIDSAEEATLLLPMASEAQQQPIVRYTDEHVKDGVVFKFDPIDRSLNDQELIERLEALADGTGKAEQNKSRLSLIVARRDSPRRWFA